MKRNHQALISRVLNPVSSLWSLSIRNLDVTLVGKPAADDYLAAWRPIMQAGPDTLWHPTLTAAFGKTLTEREHYQRILDEVPCPLFTIDPGSTNLGWPGADGLPEGIIYGNSYDAVKEGFAFCGANRMGAQIAILNLVFCEP